MLNPQKEQRYLDMAKAVALSSEGVGGKGGNTFRLGAILLDSRGRVLKAKTNSMKTHPALRRFTPYPFLHAEQACILSHGLENCEGLTLVVARVRRDGSLGLAKPCPVCARMLEMVGVKSIVYSKGEYP